MIEKCEVKARSCSRVGVKMASTLREQPRCIDASNFRNCSVGVAGWKATFRFALRVDDFAKIDLQDLERSKRNMVRSILG